MKKKYIRDENRSLPFGFELCTGGNTCCESMGDGATSGGFGNRDEDARLEVWAVH